MEPRPHADDINNIMRLPGDHQTQPNLIVDRSRRRRGGERVQKETTLSLSFSLSAHVIDRHPKKKKEKWTRANIFCLIETMFETMLSHLDWNILFRFSKRFENVPEN